MSDNSDNPFSPSRRQNTTSQPESGGSLSELVPEDESDEYQLDYRADDFDYDPDEILDDEEEPGGWADPTAGLSARRDPPADDGSAASAPPAEEDLFDDDDIDDDGYDAEAQGLFDEDEDTSADRDWDDYEEDEEERGFPGNWPLGLIGAGVVALVLLAVGGFGVLQERASLREEIRDLRSQLAVTVDPEQLSQERSTQRELVERNEALSASLETLRLENRQLTDTVAGLERQLEAQRAAAEQAAQNSSPKPSTPAPKPVTSAPATGNTPAGDWFVNFGSYRQRELADTWAGRLQPAAGKVAVQAAPGGDLYRVRIVSLPDKATAQAVASALQSQYDLPELWVGED
ncbi:hypothetical protein FV139_09005 [Parahaliea maris]|uniref:SPOR domain-containing protein n=1 Tax=Parahaliea maris TaxID=2716870 RepID=A0A5C9A2C7_9GAMM|nr:SPOR domain-containing protein [Parahaliea maris]TXS93767.1 hypothetical protein FV139_09005 [Parahaliea maris]